MPMRSAKVNTLFWPLLETNSRQWLLNVEFITEYVDAGTCNGCFSFIQPTGTIFLV